MSIFSNLWNLILIDPLLNVLFLFYRGVGNMGVSIILLSLIVKLISYPQTKASMELMKKQNQLTPELEKLKKKYGHDKKKLAEEQMELYKKAGINPAAGCLTQIFPFFVIIALFNVINMIFGSHSTGLDVINPRLYFDFLRIPQGGFIDPMFLYLNLSKPDKFFILPVLAAAAQFVSSKLMMPSVKKLEKVAEKTDDAKDDVMYNMQEQMLYTMPIVFLIVGVNLPSGVVLNILTTTLFSLVQQYSVTGFGSIKRLFAKESAQNA